MALHLSLVPDKALVVRREKSIVAASWFGRWVQRPYIYPFLAPGALEVTRLGHPKDPVSHSHHRSIWVGHHDVGGVDFWGETPRSGSIVQKDVEIREADGDRVQAVLVCSWQTVDGKRLLEERRSLTFLELPQDELALELELELRAAADPVVLGVTHFGLLGIRVAQTLRVHDGLGGRIVNSEEAEDEAGCFGQHAVWCDYSGPVPVPGGGNREGVSVPGLRARTVGIVCFDHPGNSPDGALWHVRDDGWMGPSLTRTAPRTVSPDKPLKVSYRVEAHAGRPWEAGLVERYRAWRRLAQERSG